MENTNFYEKLKAEFPEFITLRLDEQQQGSLKSLIGYTEGALTSYRIEVAEANEKYKIYAEQIRDEKRTEALNAAKAKMQKTLDTEFKHIQDRVINAENALVKATRQPATKDSSEELLRFLRHKEIRDSLSAMSLSKRTEYLINGVQRGDAAVLRAVEAQSVVSDLVPSDVLNRANEVYIKQVAPQQTVELKIAQADLEGAEVIRNLTQVVMGHLENEK